MATISGARFIPPFYAHENAPPVYNRSMTKPRSFAPIIAAVLLLLPLLYVGSYLALVVPEGFRTAPYEGPGGLFAMIDAPIQHYRHGGRNAERFFWPLEHIDRRVRPGVWQTMPEPWFSNP
jgi:hypothetical protein